MPLENIFEPQPGKKVNQKLKPYIVYRYLLKHSSENKVIKAQQIVDFLMYDCQIYAERRSIYQDIEAINKIALMMSEGCSVDEAEEMLADDIDDEWKTIVFDKHKRGFYVKRRPLEPIYVQLLAECIYSAKFLSKSQTKTLLEVLNELVSDEEAKAITHDVLLVDRVKTNSTSVINNISAISQAIKEDKGIKFRYQTYSFNGKRELEAKPTRHHGAEYIVSPYQLLLNEGNYYLLAFDENKQQVRTYRVDRMKGIKPKEEQRMGQEAFKKVDMSHYTRRVFSMYSGKKEWVKLRFRNELLDAVIDRFGLEKDVSYAKDDEEHFTVMVEVEISNPFFGWLLGFGRKVKILEPAPVVKKFKSYLDNIRSAYE